MNVTQGEALSTPKTPAIDPIMPESHALHRNLRLKFPLMVRGEGIYLFDKNGQKYLDASGGASVVTLGHNDPRVNEAVYGQMKKLSYCATTHFSNEPYEKLCDFLIDSTQGRMALAYILNSGSEATEAALKLARQYHLEKPNAEPQRVRFLSRHGSYHGITLGSLSVSGHSFRRQLFEPLLSDKNRRVSPCYAYRRKMNGESDDAYVDRLKTELDEEFRKVGPDTVCAFIAEPIVGAALGCVPSVPGYFKAVREVCDKYGALLILDEVMCGMGRTGTLHAWEQEGPTVPDIQIIAKGLGGGYQPAAGILAGHRVVDALKNGSGVFVHGHTYQGLPPVCAGALKVQQIIQEDGLLENVRKMGDLLSNGLIERLGQHPNVGNIRGRGLFWGIEFVMDKETAEPFPYEEHVAMELAEMGISPEYCVFVYPGAGGVDGVRGDHIIISPPFIVTERDVDNIVDAVSKLVHDFFETKLQAIQLLKAKV